MGRHDIKISTRNQPFDDLQMGPLLGQGSFGKVYRAIWNGAPVAVKVGPEFWFQPLTST